MFFVAVVNEVILLNGFVWDFEKWRILDSCGKQKAISDRNRDIKAELFLKRDVQDSCHLKKSS